MPQNARSEQPESKAADQGPPAKMAGKTTVKFIVLVIVAGLFAVLYFQFGDKLTLKSLSQQEAQLREYRKAHPVLVYGIVFAIYVAVTGLSLPGATVLTLLTGWFFQFWRGLVLVSFASTAGATAAFLLSRYLLRDVIQRRFHERLSSFNQALEREGGFYLFWLRLIPAVPFVVINAVMGLTPIRVWTFWWVSQLGMLPGTCVYVYAGAQVPTLKELADKGIGGILTPQLITAFVLLGLFPLAAKKIMERIRRTPVGDENEK